MKKGLAALLALLLVLSFVLPVLAADDTEGGWTIVNPKEKRGIKLQKVTDPEVEEGISPTTGLDLAEDYEDIPEGFEGLAVTGRYLPMMVQIDNTHGGMLASEPCQPWGLSYADVVYESPLQRNGYTRISFIFSDLIPNSVGPVRSARVGHVWIREEWDAGFLYYGGQYKKGSNIKEEFASNYSNVLKDPTGEITKRINEEHPELKACRMKIKDGRYLVFSDVGTAKNPKLAGNGKKDDDEPWISSNVLFSGTDGAGAEWKQFEADGTPKGYSRLSISGRASLHSVDANVANISRMVNPYHAPKVHAWRFTDDIPDGDNAEEVRITWGAIDYGSLFVYDADTNAYYRFMRQEKENVAYEDLFTGEQGAFANVIVQHITMSWNRAKDAPVTHNVDEGNADFFMAGVHVAGYWKRDSMISRTIFYGPDGKEIELQRGKTFISMLPEKDTDPMYKSVKKELAYR